MHMVSNMAEEIGHHTTCPGGGCWIRSTDIALAHLKTFTVVQLAIGGSIEASP